MDKYAGGALAASAIGVAVWRSLDKHRKESITKFFGDLVEAVQESAIQERLRRQTLLEPPPKLLPPMSVDSARLSDLVASLRQSSEALTEKSVPVTEPDARWREVIRHPAVVLILGKRGSGKSALAYRLLELFRHQLAPYVVGAPSSARRLLPDWIGTTPSLEDLPHRSIALVDEAYMQYHSRRSMADRITAMSQMLNLSRQREQTLVFVSQEARQLDRNVASSSSVVVFKDLGVLQLEFERKELRKIAADAQRSFASVSNGRQRWSFVYSPDADFVAMLESGLPSFWKPSLSKIFAGEGGSGPTRVPTGQGRIDKVRRAEQLRANGFSYGQIAKELGVSKSTVVNYLRDYPYGG